MGVRPSDMVGARLWERVMRHGGCMLFTKRWCVTLWAGRLRMTSDVVSFECVVDSSILVSFVVDLYEFQKVFVFLIFFSKSFDKFRFLLQIHTELPTILQRAHSLV